MSQTRCDKQLQSSRHPADGSCIYHLPGERLWWEGDYFNLLIWPSFMLPLLNIPELKYLQSPLAADLDTLYT